MVGLLALLTILAGVGAARTASVRSASSTSIAPPFHHVIPELSQSIFTQYCNATAKFNVLPQASPHTGIGTMKETSRSTACANQYSQSSIVGSVGFGGIDFTATSNTTVNVTFTWNVTWSMSLVATVPFGQPVYNSYAYGQIYEEDLIYDTSNGATVGFTFANIWENFTTNSSVVFSGTNVTDTSAVFTVTAGHIYSLQPNIYAYAGTFAYPGCSGRAVDNLGTGGAEAKLALVTIT